MVYDARPLVKNAAELHIRTFQTAVLQRGSNASNFRFLTFEHTTTTAQVTITSPVFSSGVSTSTFMIGSTELVSLS